MSVECSNVEESPHGPLGSRLGMAAMTALETLKVETAWRGGTSRRWHQADYAAFYATASLLAGLVEDRSELVIDLSLDEAYDSVGDGMRLDYHVDQFGLALPFYESERSSLAWTSTGAVNPAHLMRQIRHEERLGGFSLNAGRWQLDGGQDMLDRWWDWRRGIHDYEGPPSRLVACNALRGMGSILVPNHPLPPKYTLPRS